MAEDNSWGNLLDDVFLFSSDCELYDNSEIDADAEADSNKNENIVNDNDNQIGEKGHEDAPINKGIKGMASEITYEWEPM